ncbi:MAG: glutamate synthase subunit beta [Chitinophagaceae bacterium]
MSKENGFLLHTRELPTKRSVEERVNDYNEFVNRYSDEDLNKQSNRCMNCGVPFCHNGCPLGNIIPEFNDAVYKKQWKDAYDILISTNNFPEFTGRICPAPCEAACVLGINQPAVVIEEIEKHIIEIAFEKGFVQPKKTIIRTGKKIAIVGSGPAGLAAAAQLNYAGHEVTVYERDDEIGGLLRYGIPDFKLEKWVVERRVKLLKEEGIEFITNCEIGVHVSLEQLHHEFDAVVLAGGSTVPRDLAIPGRNLKGIYFAMQFLKQQNKKVANKIFSEELIDVANKNVLVIGGGDTGSDCIGTSNRHKAKSIIQFELLPMPPKERNEQMPWPSYPMLLKTTSSHEEGANREWSIATKEFLGNEKGELVGVKTVKIEWGNGGFKEVEGSEKIIDCDAVFLALGFLHPQHDMLKDLGVEINQRGNVQANEKDYKTNVSNIFTAGDMRRGQSLVVWAISEGRECARAVDEFLQGYSLLESKDNSLISSLVS